MPENTLGNLAAGAGGIHTALLGMPSVFERLIHIGSLVNHETRDGGTAKPPDSGLRQLLRSEQQAVFEHWLRLKLRAKVADLEACGEDQGRTPIEIMRYWIQPRRYRNLIPAAAPEPQRGLFELEFEILWPIMAANAFPAEMDKSDGEVK